MDSKAFNKEEIEKLIPHRYPFSFLESAELLDENLGKGIALWDKDDIIFKGHFPQFPIVPGVCLIEAAAQVAAVIISASGDDREVDENIGVLVGANKFSVKRPVLPNQRVEIKMKLKRTFPKMIMAYSKGRINDDDVFEVQLILGMISKKELSEKQQEIMI